MLELLEAEHSMTDLCLEFFEFREPKPHRKGCARTGNPCCGTADLDAYPCLSDVGGMESQKR